MKRLQALASIVATTTPGGAKNGQHAELSPLTGKTVYLWPDNDAAGIEHMQKLAVRLQRLDPAPKVLWIDPEGGDLPQGGDCVDFLAKYQGVEAQRLAVQAVLQDAAPIGAAAELIERLEDMIAGRLRSIPLPYPALDRLAKPFMPGTVTLLCGEGGRGKTFWGEEVAAYLHRKGVKIALYLLEESRAFHLHRGLAQAEANANLMDDAWVREHPDEVRHAYGVQGEFLDTFGQRIWEAPDEQVTLDQLAAWVEARVADGSEVIIIDPVTAAEATAKPWISDLKFLIRVKAAVKNMGARLLLTTHPKKGRRTAVGLHELAGGASYARFVQSVFWLESFVPSKPMRVRTALGVSEFDINRVVRIIKARNGKGAGLRIAYTFDGDALAFRKHGIVVPKQRESCSDEADCESVVNQAG